MKKFFIAFLMIGLIFSMSHIANAQMGNIEIICEATGPNNCLLGKSFTYDAGDYKISVLDGYLGTSTLNSANLGYKYFWGMDISGSSTDGSVIDLTLGNYSFDPLNPSDPNDGVFDLGTEALNAARTPGFVNFSVAAGHTANLKYFVNDASPRDNIGSLTVNVTTPIVPEPISSILFLVGGSTLAARRFMRRKKIDRQ